MNKIVAQAQDAVRDVADGSVILCGGFGLCGIPENLFKALAEKAAQDALDRVRGRV